MKRCRRHSAYSHSSSSTAPPAGSRWTSRSMTGVRLVSVTHSTLHPEVKDGTCFRHPLSRFLSTLLASQPGNRLEPTRRSSPLGFGIGTSSVEQNEQTEVLSHEIDNRCSSGEAIGRAPSRPDIGPRRGTSPPGHRRSRPHPHAGSASSGRFRGVPVGRLWLGQGIRNCLDSESQRSGASGRQCCSIVVRRPH